MMVGWVRVLKTHFDERPTFRSNRNMVIGRRLGITHRDFKSHYAEDLFNGDRLYDRSSLVGCSYAVFHSYPSSFHLSRSRQSWVWLWEGFSPYLVITTIELQLPSHKSLIGTLERSRNVVHVDNYEFPGWKQSIQFEIVPDPLKKRSTKVSTESTKTVVLPSVQGCYEEYEPDSRITLFRNRHSKIYDYFDRST